MGWALAICFVIGAISALRLPVLIFTLIVLVVMAAYAVFSFSTGSAVLPAVGWSIAFAAALEAGYLFTHGALYFLYVRRASDRRSAQKIQSKYTAD